MQLELRFRDQAAMVDKAFFQSGNTPTLFAAFFYFDISFMVWVMLGPLGPLIAGDSISTTRRRA
jgi:nitrate/nitrite transporter NarK